MSNNATMLPHWIRVSESALRTQEQPLSEPHQASQVWSKPPRGHDPDGVRTFPGWSSVPDLGSTERR
jgi:hypothetical protein